MKAADSSTVGRDWRTRFDAVGATWTWPGDGPHARYQLEDTHANWYFNSDVVASTPALVDAVIDQGVMPACGAERPDWVIAPVTSIAAGLILAAGLARALGARVGGCDVRDLRISAPVRAGQTAIICTDDVHGGTGVRVTHDVLTARGLVTSRIVALANFSTLTNVAGVPIHALFAHRFGVWPAAKCPLCATGSAALDARGEWAGLTGATSVLRA